jgi:hypothetical protein
MPASFWTPAFFFYQAVFGRRAFEPAPQPQLCAQLATMSNECVSSAVFAIMIDAEQYLSCDRLIARSTVAGFRFLPVTVKWK